MRRNGLPWVPAACLAVLCGCSSLPPLHSAARAGNLKKAERIIAEGKGLNELDKDGRSALHCAAERNRVAIARLLLSKGADVDAKDRFGWTPLFEGACNNQLEMVEFLLFSGASVSHRCNGGTPPLYVASFYRSKKDFDRQVAVVGLLIEAGARPCEVRKRDPSAGYESTAMMYRWAAEYYQVKGDRTRSLEHFRAAADWYGKSAEIRTKWANGFASRAREKRKGMYNKPQTGILGISGDTASIITEGQNSAIMQETYADIWKDKADAVKQLADYCRSKATALENPR